MSRYSWTHAPDDDVSWRDLSRGEQLHAAGIVLVIILVGLAGSVR